MPDNLIRVELKGATADLGEILAIDVARLIEGVERSIAAGAASVLGRQLGVGRRGKATATDLDDDGRDELALDVGPGAVIDYVEFYRVDPGEVSPLVVSEPGDPLYVEPGPAILGGGFDSGLWSPIQCRAAVDGSHELVSVHA